MALTQVTPQMQTQPLTQPSAQATTSGTSIDFTSIPSWVKRITVQMNAVSTNGTSLPLVRIGSGSVDTTGYDSVASSTGTGVATSTSTAGFLFHGGGVGGAATVVSGHMILSHVGSNTWVASWSGSAGAANVGAMVGGGVKTLSGVLDRVRLTTVNGTDVFDAGSVNIIYE